MSGATPPEPLPSPPGPTPAAEPPLSVAIVGPGALGEVLARLLERGGARVVRLGRGGPVRGGGQARGGANEGEGEGAAEGEGGAVEAALVTVKSYDTEAALDGLARAGLVGAATWVVSLQNGLGNVEAIARAFGEARAAGGYTTHAARRRADGEVEHTAAGETRIAPAAPGEGARRALARVAARLAAHGLAVEVAPALGPLVWEKACVSCALNPVTALLGVPNGAVAALDEARALALEAAGEVARLACALGVGIDGADRSPAEAAARAGRRALAVAERTAANRSSMLQDLEAGRRTEVDALSLAVARLAAERGLAAPVNRALGLLVRARERAAGGGAGDGATGSRSGGQAEARGDDGG